ncbi:MAG: N-acetylneuraminate synthase family protein [Firmicutes bacterium]|nr:N-acetylneuraminate synthase family protein [Bacillota bacterium]
MKNAFPKVIKIGDRSIGEDKPCYIIADIGANFDGNIDKAKRLIFSAKECGADCAKFQSFRAEKIVSAGGFAKMQLKGVHGSWGRPVHEVFRDAEFPREWHKELNDYCKEIGIHFSTSPYDFEAVDLCGQLDLPFIKIGSGEITWLEMLDYIARKNKPMFLATGDATMAEIDEALKVIESTGNTDLMLMQCITNYPSKIESANIRVLDNYKTAFNIMVGYSDHSPGPVVALGAIALGAKVIEKHFTLDKTDAGPDHPHSMDANEFKKMVEYIKELEAALGTSRKVVVEEESETVIVQRRGLYTNKKIAQGNIIRLEDIVELRPALGVLPKFKNIVAGKVAKNDIDADSPIYWENI